MSNPHTDCSTYIPLLQKTRLFSGIDPEEIRPMLSCLGAHAEHYEKGAVLFPEGGRIREIMIVAEGELHIQRYDYWGNGNIIQSIGPGDMFGEAYITREPVPLLNNVVAVADTTVICFDASRIMTTCASSCHFHAAVTRNLFFAISDRNRILVQKLGYMSQRTTKEKLMSYLSDESRRQGTSSFSIPFNRQQLADFLSVDRSAMSAELGRMRDEGLITFHKNAFTLL